MTVAGKWDFTGLGPAPYGDETTYKLGADFLRGLKVEDWGCGLGWFGRLHDDECVGVDGSPSQFCTTVADLCTYRSTPEGIFMRHVLEHNVNWRAILANALESFQKRFCLVLFGPLGKWDRELTPPKVPIPDLELCEVDFRNMLHSAVGRDRIKEQVIATKSRYNTERVFYLEKP